MKPSLCRHVTIRSWGYKRTQATGKYGNVITEEVIPLKNICKVPTVHGKNLWRIERKSKHIGYSQWEPIEIWSARKKVYASYFSLHNGIRYLKNICKTYNVPEYHRYRLYNYVTDEEMPAEFFV